MTERWSGPARRWFVQAVLAAAFVLGPALSGLAQTGVTFTEFPLGLGARSDITPGPDGALWFTDLFDFGLIGRITTDGVVTHYQLPDARSYPDGKFPWRITTGPDGALWFTEARAGRIGRITVSGEIQEFPLPSPDRQPQGIAVGPDGALWYTESSGGVGRIGRMTVDGDVTEWETPPCEGSCSSYPTGIVAGPDGALWFTDLGSSRVWRITTSGVITKSPSTGVQAGEITVGPDGALWFTGGGSATALDTIGRITTAGVSTVFPLPVFPRPTFNGYNNVEPSSIVTGPDGALWFTSARVNAIGRIALDGLVTYYRLPGGSADDDTEVIRSITVAPDGSLWITNHTSIVRGVIAGDVPVDVKPGSCENPLNPNSKGVLPVAILGTASLDVRQIDVTSIHLEGVPVLRASFEDVAAPAAPGGDGCSQPFADGRLDLTLKFATQAVVSALGTSSDAGRTRTLRLEGRLKPEFGGTPIFGQDSVLLVGHVKP